jgi:hypothetical protein
MRNMSVYEKIAIAVILVLLILASLFLNTSNYVPANELGAFSQLHTYTSEGFTNGSAVPTEYTSYPTNQAFDSATKWEISPSASTGACYKVMGTNGLACSPDAVSANPIDIYSNASGSSTCQSYGLTNSRGFLCLDDKQRTLYTSRGGNASGGGGDIGLSSK